jgi:predicted heme/steroid binding protein
MWQGCRNVILRIGLASAVGLIACSVLLAQNVVTNAMPGTNFSKFHTYKWVPIEGGAHPNQIVDQEIKQSIDAQLSAKGLIKTDAENADLYIAYQVAVNQQKQWNAWGTGRGFGGGMGQATSSTIDTGTLALDMYDPSSKQLVWQGRATKTLEPSGNQQKNEKNLNKAIAKLLKNFPPKA